MCGIFGEFLSNSELSKKEDFIRLNDLNQQRGPDASGYWSNSTNCQLGFRRLSILDLSAAGNQPMFSNDGRWVLVFNGEIYNYEAIKMDLESLGSGPWWLQDHPLWPASKIRGLGRNAGAF